ncbi:MAG: hypothetical protein L6420_06005 [Elusimicrobia bacterium]|nr:hypothetical protein [Elusimicrobiota bacterium]
MFYAFYSSVALLNKRHSWSVLKDGTLVVRIVTDPAKAGPVYKLLSLKYQIRRAIVSEIILICQFLVINSGRFIMSSLIAF